MATSSKAECPACGGKTVVVIRHLGERYYQCMTPRTGHLKGPGREKETVPCKFWSTKWRPADGN